MEIPWYLWFQDHVWAIEILIVLAALAILNLFLKKIVLRSRRQARFNETDWRSHLDFAAIAPTRFLLWVLLISFLIELVDREFKLGGLFVFVASLRSAGIIICIAWFLLRWKKVFQNALASRRLNGKLAFDPSSLEMIGKIFTIMVIFIALLVLMQLMGVDILPLVTFGGIGMAAIGIAGKDVIANFFGGLMLYITRPFTVGDLIEIRGKQILGHIEEIGWYLTSIRDQQKRPIYVPNAIFSTEFIVNLSRMTHRRIEEVVQIASDDIGKVVEVVKGIRSLFEKDFEIDRNLPVYVFFKTFGAYSLDIEIQAYTLSTRYEEYMEIKQKILLEIADIVSKSGAEMSCPKTLVELVQ